MSDMMQKMEETQKDLVNKRIVQETIDPAAEILTRMAGIGKSRNEKRCGRKKDNLQKQNPQISNLFPNFKYNSIKNAATDLLKTVHQIIIIIIKID